MLPSQPSRSCESYLRAVGRENRLIVGHLFRLPSAGGIAEQLTFGPYYAVQRASEMARHTIFLLAQQVRKNSWASDKLLMERVIPILRALIGVDPHKHYYFGQLAFALKDTIKPEWNNAKTSFDRAIELLGENEAGSWPWYNFNRAHCSIKLDANFSDSKQSDAATRKAILQDLGITQRGLGDLSEILEQPRNVDIRRWLEINRVSRISSS